MHNTTIYMFHLYHTLPWYIRDTIISIDKWAVLVTTVALKAFIVPELFWSSLRGLVLLWVYELVFIYDLYHW